MFDESDIIFKYTDEMAVADGVLVDLDKIFPRYKGKGLFRYATSNLLSKGYIVDYDVKKAAIFDLLMQGQHIVKKQSDNLENSDWFYSGKIELPDGTQQEIFIAQNETGRLTLMLPEDY
ncbi:MAG: hypothetical protein WBI57_17105 [Desulfobacterales bacterium]